MTAIATGHMDRPPRGELHSHLRLGGGPGTPVLSDTETLHHGIVKLDWQDIEDAGWYVVQYYHVEDGEWLDLPAEGVDIAFHGSSAG